MMVNDQYLIKGVGPAGPAGGGAATAGAEGGRGAGVHVFVGFIVSTGTVGR